MKPGRERTGLGEPSPMPLAWRRQFDRVLREFAQELEAAGDPRGALLLQIMEELRRRRGGRLLPPM